jgi:hypothetical protein
VADSPSSLQPYRPVGRHTLPYTSRPISHTHRSCHFSMTTAARAPAGAQAPRGRVAESRTLYGADPLQETWCEPGRCGAGKHAARTSGSRPKHATITSGVARERGTPLFIFRRPHAVYVV